MSAERNPLAVVVNGVEWRPFSVEFTTDEGTFGFELFAVDWAHAEMRLEELKATARIMGEVHGRIPG